MPKFECFSITKQGCDSDVNDDFVVLDPDHGIFVIADGMGGRPAGNLAAAAAAETFVEELKGVKLPFRLEDGCLRHAVALANGKVQSLAEADSGLAGMGTTLSAAVMNGARGKLVHVGDSRVYVLRKGCLMQVTRDHTLVAELIERDHLSEQEAESYPLRHMLTRSIDGQEAVEPDISDILLKSGDWLLLATDGLGRLLSQKGLEAAAGAHPQNAESLCLAIMKTALQSPPPDDVTLAVIRLLEKMADGTNHRD